MSEQKDKPLHDWVRQSLDTYRPEYSPADWGLLQRRLRRRRWRQRGIIAGLSLLLIGLFSWLIMGRRSDQSNLHSVIVRPAVTTPVATSKRSNLSVSSLKKNTLSSRKTRLFHTSSVPGKEAYQAVNSIRTTPASISITHRLTPVATQLTQQIAQPEIVAFSPEETAIKQQMLTGNFGPDSTTYRALVRNLLAWSDAVIVCDLTTSMYPYTTQLFAWLKKQTRNPAIKGVVFFTDCDSLGQQTHPGGPAGQFFVTRERNPVNALPTLLAAARNTVRNKDDAENDVEALLFAQRQFPDAKQLILIADNISSVKDMALLSGLQKPVHVIVCGTTGSNTALAFQPDYYTIASHTHGSLHTLDDDILPRNLSRTTTLRVGEHYYRYLPRKKRFKLTPFDHRPRHFLGLIWL